MAAKFLKFQQQQQALQEQQQKGEKHSGGEVGAGRISKETEERDGGSARTKKRDCQSKEAAAAQAAVAADAQEVEDEESSSDGESESESESESEDENDGKTGWEKMDHNGKFYYWNWDTSETTWKRPKDYDSAEDANPETAAAAIAKRKSAGSSGGPTAAATAGSKRGTPAKDGERSSKQEARQREAKAFRKLLAEGVEVKKFSQNSRFRAKPSARVLWLDTRSQVSVELQVFALWSAFACDSFIFLFFHFSHSDAILAKGRRTPRN